MSDQKEGGTKRKSKSSNRNERKKLTTHGPPLVQRELLLPEERTICLRTFDENWYLVVANGIILSSALFFYGVHTETTKKNNKP